MEQGLSHIKIGYAVKKEKGFEIALKADFGRAKTLKSELRRRGIWQGLLPHIPDDWGRQLAAGRGDKIRTCDFYVPNKYAIVF